jgi:hypothetical protein
MNQLKPIQPAPNFAPTRGRIIRIQVPHRAFVHPLKRAVREYKHIVQPLLRSHRAGPQDLVAVNRVLERLQGSGILVWVVAHLAARYPHSAAEATRFSERAVFSPLLVAAATS